MGYRRGNIGTQTEFEVTGTTTTIEDLTNDRLYQVRVQATSEAGTSDWSDPAPTGTPVAQSA